MDPSGHFAVTIPAGYYVASAVVSFAASIVVTRDIYDVVTGKREEEYKKKLSKVKSKGKAKNKIKNRKRIWYTKDFNYRYGPFWRKRVTYSDDCKLMEYEFEGNEIYFENKNDIKSCFKIAMKAYSQVIFQMNKCQGNFITFLQLVEAEDENAYDGWNIQIRFYFDRNKRSEVQTLWGNIEDFRNPTLWVYI